MQATENIEAIKANVNLLDLVRQDLGEGNVRLLSEGAGVALCAFHQERTPSMRVDKTRYHCFGCGARGDAIDWLRKYRGLSFGEALTFVGGNGFKPKRAPGGRLSSSVDCEGKLDNLRVNKLFYESRNNFPKPDSVAESYIVSRFGALESPHHFYVPPNLPPPQEMGIDIDSAVSAGLCGKSLTGAPYWRIKDRVCFPLRDNTGAILGFSGRIIPRPGSDSLPKYINPPDTPAFKKKRYVYVIDDSPPWLGPDTLYLVEGHVDCIALSKTGVSVGAIQGCCASREQVLSISEIPKVSFNIVFDNDSAGWLGAVKLAESLLEETSGRKVYITLIEGHKDIDDLLSSGGTLSSCKSIRVAKGKLNLPPMESKKKFSRKLLDEMTAKYVQSNIDDGFPQLNYVHFIKLAYPEVADRLDAAIKKMTDEAKPGDDGLMLIKKSNILNFISIWAEACRDMRHNHKLDVGDG